MCGICGIVIVDETSNPFVGKTVLDAMTDALIHRGPDGRGVQILNNGRVGFGHRRLAIIDLSSRGAQPMSNEDGTVWVTFNGEIYNYQLLRADLKKKGHQFRSNTDTEVLVHLYEEFQDEMVDYLDGDFAFGIWDDRRKRLLLARDRAGVKPLYYTFLRGQFLFASEIKALLQHPDVSRTIDEEALYYYLTYIVVPPPKTLFRDIYKLPSASLLTLDLGVQRPGHHIRKHWEPIPGQIQLDYRNLDAQLEELLDRAVQKRLMSDVPVGTLFSGGVDSTLNTVLFQQKVKPQKVRTYHAGVAGMTPWHRVRDESGMAARMASQIGTEHYEIKITVDDLLATAQTLAYYQDEPISDPVNVPLYFVTKLAKESGTTVLHAGEGADEIFCGYDSYRRWMRQYKRFWMPVALMPTFISRLGFQLLRYSTKPRDQKIAGVLSRRAKGQGFFQSAAIAYYDNEKQGLLSPKFLRRYCDFDSFDIVTPLYKRIEELRPEATFLQKLTFIELQLRLPELLLMRVDKMAMANAVEVRVPFLDRYLVDFALSAPESFKLRDGVAKEPLKRLAERYVGHETVYRPKLGFGLPIQAWVGAEVGEQIRSMLDEDRTEIEEYFNIPYLKHKLDGPLSTVNQAFQLWVIYNFLNWRRAYFC